MAKPVNLDWQTCRKKPVEVKYAKVPDQVIINTREGSIFAYPDKDYIIMGAKHTDANPELYPIKIDVFNATYDVDNEFDTIIKELRDIQAMAEDVCEGRYISEHVEDIIERMKRFGALR